MAIPRWVKSLLTAHYNPETGEIGGCEPGTLAYKHEERHKEQFSYPLIFWGGFVTHLLMLNGGWIGVYLGFLLKDLAVAFTFIGLTAIPYLALQLCLEIDAWMVSTYRHFKEGREIKYWRLDSWHRRQN